MVRRMRGTKGSGGLVAGAAPSPIHHHLSKKNRSKPFFALASKLSIWFGMIVCHKGPPTITVRNSHMTIPGQTFGYLSEHSLCWKNCHALIRDQRQQLIESGYVVYSPCG